MESFTPAGVRKGSTTDGAVSRRHRPGLRKRVRSRGNARRDARALSDVTAFQIWLQMVHRFVAMLIALAIVAFCARVWREVYDFAALRRLSLLWVVLVVGQITLGAWVIWSNKAADVATAHVALGAVMLCFGVSISAICWKITQTERGSAPPPGAPQVQRVAA